MLKKLNHIAIVVPDVKKAKEIYKDLDTGGNVFIGDPSKNSNFLNDNQFVIDDIWFYKFLRIERVYIHVKTSSKWSYVAWIS